jgi:phasin family protein
MYDFNQSRSPAASAHLEAQFLMFTDLTKQLFGAMQKVNELNIQVAQTLMEETLANTRQVLSAKDPTEALSVIAGQAQPNAEKVRAYQQHLTDIAAGTQVNLAKTAETHVPQTTRTAQDLAEEVARRASEETEKATQRQRAAMEKLTTPIGKPGQPGKGNAPGVH